MNMRRNKKMKNKKWILVITFFVASTSLNLRAFGQDNENTRPTLRGLQGMFVHVEPLDPQIEKGGLTKNQIQADTELKLHSAGINVLTREEFLKISGHPYLYVCVNISILKTQITRYLFYIIIELNQEVVLVRAPDTKVSAATWSAGGWGIDFSLDNIRQTVKTQVDRFISVYLAETRK
jgi:hypothetical protein